MNLPESAKAKCPFYEKYCDREIQCESRLHRARLIFVFRNGTEALHFKREYCDQYQWCACEYAQLLNRAYHEEMLEA